MSGGNPSGALRDIKTLFSGGTLGGQDDRQLLERFVKRNDAAAEDAFAILLERHGPMVWGVCCRLLPDRNSAADAFQATFLVLLRKASAVRVDDSLGPWLHGVSRRVATRARATSLRRAARETGGVDALAGSVPDPDLAERLSILDEEIGRLPDHQREAVVLCDLQGLPHEEVARRLGCPVGTIESRLSRGRRRLRDRLVRRGLAPAAASLWHEAVRDTSAAIPAALIKTTARFVTASRVPGAVPVAVAAYAQGVIQMMWLARFKPLAAATAVLVVATAGMAVHGRQQLASTEITAQGKIPPSSRASDDDALAHAPVTAANQARARQQLALTEEARTSMRQTGQNAPIKIPGAAIQGKVVDDQGKPAAGVPVVLFAPKPSEGRGDPVEARTISDATGRFRLDSPLLARVVMNGPHHVWAYQPGSAITATVAPSYRPPLELGLRKPEPRTVKVEGPDGRPIAGAIVSPRVVSIAGTALAAEIPDGLATPLAVTTGADGKATLDYLAAGDPLVAVRVVAESIGSQDLQLVEDPRRDNQAGTITIRLKSTSRLAGRVRNRSGEPAANQMVEVWFKGGDLLRPNPIGFKNGPLRTAADGSFQTPDNLLVGAQYRVVVRGPGMEPILSNWLTIGEKPRVLLPMIQRPLRTVSGRVVDRQGKPVPNVEIFQSGDGPDRTATRSGADGRFALGGFRQGPVFLFARGDGFRFSGRLINSSDQDITMELTRTGERPPREMRMLPEAISWEESRALARRLIEPCWEAAVARKDDRAASRALRVLAVVDPESALQKLKAKKLADPLTEGRAARALARIDPVRAEEVAEAIELPASRALALVDVADSLPPDKRDQKFALLARAATAGKAANSPYRVSDVADRWLELGEKEKAKSLFAEAVRLGKDGSLRRRFFAARLAQVDLPGALAIAGEFPAGSVYSADVVLRDIANRLASDNPAEAERVLRMIPHEAGRSWFHPALAWKMAATDPARAQRLVDEAQRYYDHPQTYLFLALGLKARDPAASAEAFQKALRGIDRLMKEGPEYSAMEGYRGVLLPLVEQIDPGLVPELFWRAIATRPPIGNPASLRDSTVGGLVALLGWYDREVAAALFEPIRTLAEETETKELAVWELEFLAWSLFNPRAAVAGLEKVAAASELDPNGNFVRERVAETLGLSYQDRWRRVWITLTEMRALLEPEPR